MLVIEPLVPANDCIAKLSAAWSSAPRCFVNLVGELNHDIFEMITDIKNITKLNNITFKNAKFSGNDYEFNKNIKLSQTLIFSKDIITFNFIDTSNQLIIDKCLLQSLKITINNNFNLTIVDSLINDNLEIVGNNNIINLLINKNKVKEIKLRNVTKINNCVFVNLNTLPTFTEQITIENLHLKNSDISLINDNFNINTLRLSNVSEYLKDEKIKSIKCEKIILEGEEFPEFISYPFHSDIKEIDIKNTSFTKVSFRDAFKLKERKNVKIID